MGAVQGRSPSRGLRTQSEVDDFVVNLSVKF